MTYFCRNRKILPTKLEVYYGKILSIHYEGATTGFVVITDNLFTVVVCRYGVVKFESVMMLREELEQFGMMSGITQDEKGQLLIFTVINLSYYYFILHFSPMYT